MINKKLSIVLVSIAFVLLLCGCGKVEDHADTPYDEEKIMELQKGSQSEASDEQPLPEIQLETAETDTQTDNLTEDISEKDVGEDVSSKTEQKNEETEAEMNLAPDEKKEEPPQRNVCTLSVKCDTILSNMEKLPKEKVPLVPKNGIIYSEREIAFQPGESVFDVLLREMKNNKIHMEFNETPAYKSAYVEGINNLYEFDCGDLSGWIYCVNGKTGNVGCSQYIVQPGDVIEWVYTCDMGRDIG